MSDQPINLVVPSTTELKMRAILALCEGIKSVAETLDSVNVHCDISNNTISGAQTGISINLTDPPPAEDPLDE